MRLTPEQRAAVTEREHVCLISCPGSGKTRTIVAKLLTCIEAVAGSTRRVACITHTNAAADEIECRLRELCFGGEDLYYEVCTIHGFTLNNVLRPYHKLLPEFSQGMRIITCDDAEYTFQANELLSRYGCQQSLFDEFERVQRTGRDSSAHSCRLPPELQAEWCAWLDSNSFVTLNEIVYHSGRIVTGFQHVASALASRFAWLLVDEFQDSSPSQILILQELHRFRRTTFFCVGDPNQSIYRFAGAEPQLLEEFGQYIGANQNHRLTGNFRSSRLICEVAEAFCPSIPSMTAVGRYAEEAEYPVHHSAPTAKAGVVGPFMEAVDRLGIPLGKVAVLAPGWFPLYTLGKELHSYGLPAIGPGARPYRRVHTVSHLVEPVGAYLMHADAKISVQVQRSLYFVLAQIESPNPGFVYSYKGRVLTCEILSAAARHREESDCAINWVHAFTESCVALLTDRQLINTHGSDALRTSARDMVEDIRSRPGGQSLSVDELGVFARPDQCVQLLTIHKAKGREFQAVAIIDCNDGRIPHFSIANIADKDEREANLAEARRVLYVAATRAQRLLMFISDRSHHRNKPSPFLREARL